MKKKKELKEKNLEQSYTIEALEDEITNLEEIIASLKAKQWELVQENDRLTMRYEPYRPPGDENEGRDFYELIDEVSEARSQISRLAQENYELRVQMRNMRPKRYKKNGVISFDFWPLRDWFRLSRHKWNPGMAAQVCVGPIRVDWFAE